MRKAMDRSFLSRLLLTTALSLPLMTASGAGVHADIVTVQGADGANGADGVNPGDPGLPGDDGESVAADAGSLHPITFPLNKATATGGNGGAGGASFPSDPTSPQTIVSGNGGEGGAATALAATSVASGPAEAHAAAIGGNGGQVGAQFAVILGGPVPGNGWEATATSSATNSGASPSGGDVVATSSATGGMGGDAETENVSGALFTGTGGDAKATSDASSGGSGNASAAATAIGGGSASSGGDATFAGAGGSATATASATTLGGGAATAKATATAGEPGFARYGPIGEEGSANATSNAEAEFGGVTAKSMTVASSQPPSDIFVSGPASASASASVTALPDEADAAALIGDASDVANALLGPRDVIFGTSVLRASGGFDVPQGSGAYSASSTFDLAYRGDLLLGLIDAEFDDGFQSMEFTITANGVEIVDSTFRSLAVAESFFHDDVLDLGSYSGPVDLAFGYTLVADGPGGFGFDFAVGGAVPQAPTWAMMLIGFAGLGIAGFKTSGAARRAV